MGSIVDGTIAGDRIDRRRRSDGGERGAGDVRARESYRPRRRRRRPREYRHAPRSGRGRSRPGDRTSGRIHRGTSKRDRRGTEGARKCERGIRQGCHGGDTIPGRREDGKIVGRSGDSFRECQDGARRTRGTEFRPPYRRGQDIGRGAECQRQGRRDDQGVENERRENRRGGIEIGTYDGGTEGIGQDARYGDGIVREKGRTGRRRIVQARRRDRLRCIGRRK
mmetsp:Transcript_49491/g.149144  ORF Transcript_49491/g.149144 Transcript_49491/m.149144 type:complete len:223 (-) Transcript_49491:849-1517(-)